MLAYLSMMTPRLIELYRVLKPSGTIFLHCDSTASHYLKILMDSIFGVKNFRNEIIWRRSQPKSHVSLRFSRAHDTLLFYAKSDAARFHMQYTPHDPQYVADFYKYIEPDTGRLYRLGDLTNPNHNRPNLTYEFPPGSGTVRVWRWTKERMLQAWEDGRVVIPGKGKVVAYKRYLDEMEGTPLTDTWIDIEHLHGSNQEQLGYPTQKPRVLLERIIKAGTKEGDTVLDPFCGCGTAIDAAESLHRRWIGIDVTIIAINLIKTRLIDVYGQDIKQTFTLVGEPTTLSEARALADQDKFQFQAWVLGLVDARTQDSNRKGADKGIDGRLFFKDGSPTGEYKEVIFSVKGGHSDVKDMRDLRGVIERENAVIGVLLTLQKPTGPMVAESASAGFYHSPWGSSHSRLQILTVEELLAGKRVDMPLSAGMNITFKKSAKAPRISKVTEVALPGIDLATVDEEEIELEEDSDIEEDDL